MFQDGIAKDRVIGFEGISRTDRFETMALIRKLVLAKMIKARNASEEGIVQRQRSASCSSDEENEF
jgi:hypothetical protein